MVPNALSNDISSYGSIQVNFSLFDLLLLFWSYALHFIIVNFSPLPLSIVRSVTIQKVNDDINKVLSSAGDQSIPDENDSMLSIAFENEGGMGSRHCIKYVPEKIEDKKCVRQTL